MREILRKDFIRQFAETKPQIGISDALQPTSIIPEPKRIRPVNEDLLLTEFTKIFMRKRSLLNRISMASSSNQRIVDFLDHWGSPEAEGNMYKQTLARMEKEGTATTKTVDFFTLMEAGHAILNTEVITNTNPILQRLGIKGDISEYVRLTEFTESGGITVRFEGVRIRDLARRRNLNVAAVHAGLTNLILAFEDPEFFEKVRVMNTDDLSKEYPEIAYLNLFRATRIAMSLLTVDPGLLSDSVKSLSGDAKEDGQKAKEILEGYKYYQSKVIEMILNPKSHEFDEIAIGMGEFLARGGIIRTLALITSGILTSDRLVKVYHHAYRLAQNGGKHKDFFALLASSIEGSVFDSELLRVKRAEDMAAYINLERVDLSSPPSVEDVGKLVSELTSMRGVRYTQFEIASDIFEKLGVVPPSEAALTFDPNNPRRFNMELVFVDELGEREEFNIDFDSTKHPKVPVEWDIFELPEQVPQIRDRLLMIAAAKLTELRDRAVDERKSRIGPPSGVTSQAAKPKEKGERPTRTKEEEGVRKNNERAKVLSPVDQVRLLGIKIAQAEAGFKPEVVLSESLEKMLEGFSGRDAQRITRTLQRGNQTGVFDIKDVVHTERRPNGEKIRRIRIGPFRVIVKQKKNGGREVYEILDVRRKYGDKTYDTL